MACFELRLSVFLDGADGDVATLVDEAIRVLGEEGATLNVVVADEMKDGMLRKRRGVVVDGSVAKVVGETRAYTVAVNYLKELPVAQDGTGFCAEDQKGVTGALHVVDRNWLGLLCG